MRRPALAVLFFGWCLATQSFGQTASSVQTLGACKDVNLEGRTINKVDLWTPFDILHLKFLNTLRNNQPIKAGAAYRDADANAAMSKLEGNPLAPNSNFGLPISFSLAALETSNCVEDNGIKKVDLKFYYLPAKIPSFWASTKESRAEDTTDGARSAGIAPRRFWLTPHAAYSASTGVVPGFSLGVERNSVSAPADDEQARESTSRGIDSFTLNLAASSKVRLFSAAATDNYAPGRSWMKQAQFVLGSEYRDEPIDNNRMKAGQGFLEWKASTGTLGSLGIVVRYGLAFEGGARRSSGPAAILADDSNLFALGSFAGATVRTVHQTFSASYGISSGHTGNGGVFDFRKHLVDVSHGLAFSPNHFPIDLDTRFNAGHIENLCTQPGCDIPLAERFFGGNVERNFLSDSSWVIRSQPLLRSMPLNGLNAAAGSERGGNHFWAFNVTSAFGIFRKPLIPEELLQEKGFLPRIDATPTTATELLASAYASRDSELFTDPAILAAIMNLLPMVRMVTSGAQEEWDKRSNSIPADRSEAFSICGDDQLVQVPLDIDDVEAKKQPVTLVSNPAGRLAKTVECLRQFSSGPTDPLFKFADQLEGLRKSINKAVESTQVYARAKTQAEKDMLVAGRTVHTLFHEANLFSIGPVFAFDAAAIGPPVSGSPSIRYGIGTGVRATILSTLRLTLGYSANMNRQPGEGRGAIFASMEILDIWGH